MRIERKTIYKDKGGSYRLILGTTKFGASFIYFSPSKVYEGIAGIKVDDIGYVCIDRVIYVSWDKFFSKTGYTEYRKLSNREYSSIVLAISQFMLGDIEAGPDKVFMYRDELEALNVSNNVAVTSEVIEKVETVTVERTSSTTATESRVSKETTAPRVEIKHDRTDFKARSNHIIDEAKMYGIPVDEDEKVNKPEVRFFDLLSSDSNSKPSTYTGRIHGSRSKDTNVSSNQNSINKHLFSEDEALAISAMNINAVMTKYNVTYNTAALMVRNAKRAFGFEVTKRKPCDRKFTELFELGYTPEQVSKETGLDLKNAVYYYNYYICTKTAVNNHSVNNKWDSIIKEGRIDLITEAVCDFSIVKFCERERCSIQYGRNIICKLRDYLSLNPLFCVGFEKLAFDQESLRKSIDNIRDSKKNADMATIFVYDITMELYDAYVKSFNSHAEILAGAKEIPDYVPDKYKDYFITLIYNRFNPNDIGSKTRILNAQQKDVVSRNASTAEFAMAFMINYKKASKVKNHYNR